MFANICCKSHKVRPYFGSYVKKNVNKNLNKTQTITRIHFVTFMTSVPLLMRIQDVILEPLHLFYRGFGTQTKAILLLIWYRLWAAWRPNLVFWPIYEACLKQPRSERKHSSLGVFSCPCPCPFLVFLASGSWSPSSLFLLPHLLSLVSHRLSSCTLLSDALPLLPGAISDSGGCWYAIHALVFGRSKVLILGTCSFPSRRRFRNVLWSGLLQSIPTGTILLFRCKAQGKQGKPEVELLGFGHVSWFVTPHIDSVWFAAYKMAGPPNWGFTSCVICGTEVLDINVFEVSFFLEHVPSKVYNGVKKIPIMSILNTTNTFQFDSTDPRLQKTKEELKKSQQPLAFQFLVTFCVEWIVVLCRVPSVTVTLFTK